MKMIFIHSIKMLLKNLKVYMALSITIIISFTILLGYLIFIDSECYNNNKKIFSVSPKVVLAQQEDDNSKLKILETMMKNSGISYEQYDYYSFSIPQLKYESVGSTFVCVPSNLKEVYESRTIDFGSDATNLFNTPQRLKMLYGRENYALEKNEAIINNSFFEGLGLTEDDLPYEMDFLLCDDNTDKGRIKLSIVGVCEDGEYSSVLHYDDNNKLSGEVRIYIAQASLNGINTDDFLEKNYYSFINTESPEKVITFENQLGLINCSAYNAQKEALMQERVDKGTKSKIIIMLLLILGVNMFGCLSNVISGRQYEIGIKRAIGASVSDIVMQFFTESMCILIVDVLLSMWCVANLVIGYKFFYWYTKHEAWVFYCSQYSIASFLVSSISITVIISIILAYKATKVEIVSQLKCE